MSATRGTRIPALEIATDALAGLRDALRLPPLLPGEAGYEEARRVWKNEGATGAI